MVNLSEIKIICSVEQSSFVQRTDLPTPSLKPAGEEGDDNMALTHTETCPHVYREGYKHSATFGLSGVFLRIFSSLRHISE